MVIKPAKRTESVQEYYFSRKLKEVAAMNAERAAAGREGIINLGIGAPDGMPPADALNTLAEYAVKPGVHAYQSYIGTPELRGAFAQWYATYYGVRLNPSTQIQPLVGSKEGILLLSLAFLNEGDKVLVPDPGYPTYTSATKLTGAEIIYYDLKEENGWLPDFEALEAMDLSGVKMMWTNYPNMPTGASATRQLYQDLVDFGRRHGIMVCNDNPYSFILNDDPLSILAAEGAMDCCVELNSLSKAHNMSGWRIGMIASSAEVISEVLKVKSQMDSGMFLPLQLAAVKALGQGPEWYKALNEKYRERRVLAGEIFDLIGAKYDKSSAGLFLWGRVTEDSPLVKAAGASCGKAGEAGGVSGGPTLSERASDAALYKAGVFITPGLIFGHNGEDYVRISLCATPEVLRQAYSRLEAIIK